MTRDPASPEPLSNGLAAAAVLSAGAGCATVGVLYVVGNAIPAVNALLSIYKPAGALSGVSTGAILVWLCLWVILASRWKRAEVNFSRVFRFSLLLLIAGLILTFPPVARLF